MSTRDRDRRRNAKVHYGCVQRGGCRYKSSCVTIKIFSVVPRRRQNQNGGQGRSDRKRGTGGGVTSLHGHREGTLAGFDPTKVFLANACRSPFLPRSVLTYQESIRGCGQQIVTTAYGQFKTEQRSVHLVLITIHGKRTKQLRVRNFTRYRNLATTRHQR